MRKTSGITLVELLIALGIFATVMALSSQGIVSGLKNQQKQEATAAIQTKLRRVNDVVTQQLRSAVFGGITVTPYESGSNSISFALLGGSGGYPVIPHDSGNNSSFVQSANLQILADVNNVSELGLEGQQALMINANGDAVIFRVGNVQKNGNEYKVRVVHPGCANTIDYTNNTLLFGNLDTVGLRYDANTKILYRTTDTNDEVALAYDIESFNVEYIYEYDDGSTVALDSPILDNNFPVKKGIYDGQVVVLARIKVSISASDPKYNILRSYSNQVELVDTSADNRIRTLRGVTVCD
ncbi:MAG: prepilin-type N-terminal cleavage/methylation domain-containing protein [Trueperaceae bacterium]|nr:prepilin-type N-terminal cleavage/methylation domain-containing protein [Trueperaceae bacterium]